RLWLWPRATCPRLPYTTLFRSHLFGGHFGGGVEGLVDLVGVLQAGHGEVGLAAALAAGDGRQLLDDVARLEALFLGQLVHRDGRSEEHTSELQSRFDLVCRLLL